MIVDLFICPFSYINFNVLYFEVLLLHVCVYIIYKYLLFLYILFLYYIFCYTFYRYEVSILASNETLILPLAILSNVNKETLTILCLLFI